MTKNKLNGAGISTPSNSRSNRGEKQAFKIEIIDRIAITTNNKNNQSI